MKKRKRKRKGRMIYTFSILLVILFFVALAFIENFFLNPPVRVDMSELDSEYAVLVDNKTGWTIGKKNNKERMYPASMTKIMTALVAIEQIPDLDAYLTVPGEIFGEIYAENASTAGFEAGETATARDFLYGVILPSGAECCLTLAYGISGSEEAFVDLMNRKAEKIGLKDTHFVNTTGLHDDDHYSTASDIAKLLRYALNSSSFREIITSRSYTTSATNVHPEGFTFYSTMFHQLGDQTIPGGEILGGKTGNTYRAGLCLASLAKVNGREYILVTAKAEDFQGSNVQDAVNIYSQIGES